MVKEAMILNMILELSNIEEFEHCILNICTGKKVFNKEKKQINKFTGLYFRDNNTFFALYPTEAGPMAYYNEKEYPIHKDLSIFLNREHKIRKFVIENYNIKISYNTSPYIGFDAWSTEIDVDLFYMIEQSYKKDEFYKKFTLDATI